MSVTRKFSLLSKGEGGHFNRSKIDWKELILHVRIEKSIGSYAHR